MSDGSNTHLCGSRLESSQASLFCSSQVLGHTPLYQVLESPCNFSCQNDFYYLVSTGSCCLVLQAGGSAPGTSSKTFLKLTSESPPSLILICMIDDQ